MEHLSAIVSVIVPVYNVESTLKRCINSIIQQTYKNLEIILVNDGSTDSSAIICQQYAHIDNRIRIIEKENGGLSSARNAGIDNANGDYLCFIDSDDWIHQNYVSDLLTLIKNFDSDIASCRVHITHDSEVNNVSTSVQAKVMDCQAFLKLIFTDHNISVYACNKLYKRKLFETVRYPQRKLYEDIVPMFQLATQCKKIAVTNQELYYYFNNPQSISRSAFKEKDEDYVEQWCIVAEQSHALFPKLDKVLKHRLIFAHFRLLNKIALTVNNSFREFEKKHIQYLRKNIVHVVIDPYLSGIAKGQMLLCIFNYGLYKKIYRYIKMK